MGVTHLLPGFALDRGCFAPLELPPDRFRLGDFIPVEKADTLPRYALRLADAIGFRPDDAVGGLSLGGMLALEIARQRGAAKVLLIASCTQPRFIRPRYRLLGHAAPWIPGFALHAFFSNLPMLLRRAGLRDRTGEAFVRDMMMRFPVDLLRGLPRLFTAWEGCEPAVPCAALHCAEDWLIRPPLHLPELTLLPGTGHLITVSKPEAVRNFVLAHAPGGTSM